jgi:tetratricopeptide (TPR) repeat protein
LRLASEALRAGRVRVAEQLAPAALDAGWQRPAAYYVLAGAARATGRLALAADMAGVGIALDPDSDAARRDLGALLLELGRADEALAVLENIAAARRDRACRERLGLAYALAGRRGQARSVFRALLAEQPHDARARQALLRLGPRAAPGVLDGIEASLGAPLASLFGRLRAGPATEAELSAALAAAGFRGVLVRALIRELAERTRSGALPLVRVGGDRVELDLSVLDIE